MSKIFESQASYGAQDEKTAFPDFIPSIPWFEVPVSSGIEWTNNAILPGVIPHLLAP